MRMIQLCKHRKIDLILTKSISRFARNVPECLDFARKLRRQGVGIIFEKEAINTLRMSDELMLFARGSDDAVCVFVFLRRIL